MILTQARTTMAMAIALGAAMTLPAFAAKQDNSRAASHPYEVHDPAEILRAGFEPQATGVVALGDGHYMRMVSRGEAKSQNAVAQEALFGTSAISRLTLTGPDFTPIAGETSAAERDNRGQIGCPLQGPAAIYSAKVALPPGARITSMRVYGKDGSTGDGLSIRLYPMLYADFPDAGLAYGPDLAVVATGAVESPGLFESVSPVPNIPEATFDPRNVYLLELAIDGCSDPFDLHFLRADVNYRRQVSPAPAVATFNDVPLNAPNRKEIEAFTAAGLSAGCGGGNFCPDAPVTRRQVATFIAKALGLHWEDN